MDSWPKCDVCGFHAYGCMSFCVLVSTMGTRAERRQKTAPSFRVCKDCRKTRKAVNMLVSRVRVAVRDLKAPEKLIKLSSLSPRRRQS